MNSLQIVILQHNTVWHNPVANQQRFEIQLNDLSEATKLVILPEMWTTGFTMTPERVAQTMGGPSIQWMKEMAKKDHTMAHKHANSLLLEPKEKGEIIWKFSSSAKLEIACNVPGHYEAGMVAKITQD